MIISSRSTPVLVCDLIADSNAIISITEDPLLEPAMIEVMYIEGNTRKTLVLTPSDTDPIVLLNSVLSKLGFSTTYEEIK